MHTGWFRAVPAQYRPGTAGTTGTTRTTQDRRWVGVGEVWLGGDFSRPPPLSLSLSLSLSGTYTQYGA